MHAPAQLQVTHLVRRGANVLAAEVIRWSDGSYLEGQDMWRLSGITRQVYLFWRPRAAIADFFARPQLDESLANGRRVSPIPAPRFSPASVCLASPTPQPTTHPGWLWTWTWRPRMRWATAPP